MKKKIRREFILVALFTITLTTLLVTAVFYEFFKKEVMDELGDYEGRVYTVDARKISVETLGKNFPNSPMLAAAVAVSDIMPRDKFIHEMRASYEHKFAKKPEVIDGNMKALERAYDVVEEAIEEYNQMSA